MKEAGAQNSTRSRKKPTCHDSITGVEGIFGRLRLASEIFITLGTQRVLQRQVMTLRSPKHVLLPVLGAYRPPHGDALLPSASKGLKSLGTSVPAWAQGLHVIPAFSPLLGQTCFPVSLFAGNWSRRILWNRRDLQNLKQQYQKSCSDSRAC